MSERVKRITYKGKAIMLVNLAGCATAEVPAIIDEAIRSTSGYPLKSLLGVTDVTGVKFNRELARKMKEYAEKTIPYLKAGASVGIKGIEKVGYDAIMMLVGATIPVFQTQEEAFEWLVNKSL